MALQVNEQSPAVARMAVDWAVIDALMGGTPAMRAAGQAYLPKQPREDVEDYNYRKSVATLYPAFERTADVMAGKPFARQITVGDDVPSVVREYLDDIDAQGSSLHVFAAKAFSEFVTYGFGGLFIDYTKTDGQAKTQADEKAMGARPFWVHYKHDAILETRYENTATGWQLVRVRLIENAEVPDDGYGVEIVEQIRVLTPGRWELHRKNGDGQWFLHEFGSTLPLNHIPFVPLVAVPKNLEEGSAPLRNLAYLNVKHWQLQSDLDDSLRYAIKPIIAITGLTDTSAQIVLQAGGMIKMPTGATLEVKQGQSEAVNTGRKEVEALEQQMIQTGAELLVATPGQRTATEASNDAEANKSQLQRMAEIFTDKLNLALQYTADWKKLPDGGKVTLFADYSAGSLSDASAQMVKELYSLGLITKERAIVEMQRRNVMDANFDAAEEVALAAEQAPRLGTIGLDPVVE